MLAVLVSCGRASFVLCSVRLLLGVPCVASAGIAVFCHVPHSDGGAKNEKKKKLSPAYLLTSTRRFLDPIFRISGGGWPAGVHTPTYTIIVQDLT